MLKFLNFIFISFFFLGCSLKEPQKSQSAVILIKTPKMKFYDKGFIRQYNDRTEVQIFNAGNLILNLKIYDDNICSSMFECMDLSEFNRIYLDKSYDNYFVRDLFLKRDKNVIFRDKSKKILIKIKKD